MTAIQQNSEFEALLDYLKRTRGFDFGAYKRTTLRRRVEKRMQTAGVSSFTGYMDYLEVHPEEFPQLFDTILINVTGFFRDEGAWEFLAGEILPKVLEVKAKSEPVRVWSAGCADGEEACTLAMVLAEALGPEEYRERAKIYATDVDDHELSMARQAVYTEKQVQGVPEKLREKYVEQAGDKYTFNRELRRNIIFGRNDLIQDAPISRVDILSCRNTLMYFNTEAQTRILARFHFALNDGGYLFLGKAEMLLTHQHMFVPVDLKRRIFSKVIRRNGRERLLVMAQNNSTEAQGADGHDGRIREIAFEMDPTAQLILDREGILIVANERARALFSISAKDIGRLFQDLEASYKPIEVRSWIEQAYSERRPMAVKEVQWPANAQGEIQYYDVNIAPLLDQGGVLGVKLSFTNATHAKKLQTELHQSRQELETAYEELQTTNEELQSTIEELETTNEELQSTNEEMETMNEELQSTNEELQTINNELRERSDELNHTNAFLKSILTSLDTGVIVVDPEMRVQNWNQKSEELWGVKSDEAVGAHLLNLDIGLPVHQLRDPIRLCLSGEKENEKLTLAATNRRGKAIQVDVTMSALRAGSDIRGVIVLVDVR